MVSCDGIVSWLSGTIYWVFTMVDQPGRSCVGHSGIAFSNACNSLQCGSTMIIPHGFCTSVGARATVVSVSIYSSLQRAPQEGYVIGLSANFSECDSISTDLPILD